MNLDVGFSAADTYLAFNSKLVPDVCLGAKMVTARYQFDRPLATGDEVALVTPDEDPFALAQIDDVTEQSARAFLKHDYEGHQSYKSVDSFLAALRQYYDPPTGGFSPSTAVTVIEYSVLEVFD